MVGARDLCNLDRGDIAAMIILCKIATIPHSDMNLTEEELCRLKYKSRISTLLIGCTVILLLLIPFTKKISSYMTLGIIYNALGLMIIKLRRKEGKP